MDFLVSIAGKIAEYLVAPVGRQLGYIFHYRRKVDNLKTETNYLKLQKERMANMVDEAKRKGDEIYDDVTLWLSEVDDKITELEEKYFAAEDSTEMKCTFKGSFSYLTSRYKLGKKAKEMGELVVKLKGRFNSHDQISFRPKLQSNFENKDYLSFGTREKFVDGIMKELGDANIRTIGLHGMPGVGKTILAKEIARKALEEDPRLFNDAVIVTVSQTPILKEIQQQIGERLDLKFMKEIENERALELRHRLKDENKFLIVLDDVWNELKLEDVGIVFESHQKGCKILFTSRFERVLGVDMGVDKNFKVELLSADEASNWFNDIVGDMSKIHEFKEIGSKIVKKCGCLPLAIVTVANSLKNCCLPIWRDAWTRLEHSEQNEIVSSAIKLCYHILENDETKKLVSLCSLHEEDANIKMEYLMRYCWGMGMFRGNMTLQNARDRMHGWVNTLKDRCLLLDGDDSGTVKMHDVVRDITISVAKESHNMHCFRDGGVVEDFLKEKKIEDLKAVSLPNGYLDELLFERSEYTQLQLMICTCSRSYMWNRSSKIIPGDFLDRIKLLRVLEFSGQVYIDYPKVLASHLSSLQNLRTLCLHESDVDDIAEIGKLNNLEILDLSRSCIKKLPSEIGQLTRLLMLDLSGCRYLRVIEPNVILHLKRLEELYVDKFENWHNVDQVDNNGEGRNAGLDELKELDHLTALRLTVPDIVMLAEVLLSPKLERYHIKIGNYDKFDPAENSVSRHLLVEHKESSLLQEHGIEKLMKRSEVLGLVGLNGVNNIVNELDTEGFPRLKSLTLENNLTIQYLVNYSMGQIHPCTAFCSLEKLFLCDLSNLKQIYHWEDTVVELFKTLRVVTVRDCISLKKLLPLFNARQIEEIEITNCNEMEEIFTHQIQDGGDDNDQVIEEFLQLRSLKLENVSKLREFCSLKRIGLTSQKEEEPFVGDSDIVPLLNGKFLCFLKLEKLELFGCDTAKKLWDDQLVPSSTSFCFLTELVVSNCKCLKYVFSSSIAAGFKHLYSLKVKCCKAMEEIVSRDERMDKMSFPKLYSLKLENLPKLSTFSAGIFIEFSFLNNLHIEDCPELKTFISESSEDRSNTTMPSFFNENSVFFPELENLFLQRCGFKKIWDASASFPRLTELNVSCCHCLKYVWDGYGSFPCLTELEVSGCHCLKYVFSSAMAGRFEQLNSIFVNDCETMEEIMSRSDQSMDNLISFPKLEFLNLQLNPNMVSFSKTSERSSLLDEKVAFPSLKRLRIEHLDGLKMICQYGICNINADSFCKLEAVEVEECNNLMGIFPSGMHTRLGNLTSLEIIDCEMVEEIFVMETSNCTGTEEFVGKQEGLETVLHPDHDDEFVFPQLQKMYLINLPNLVSIYAGTHTLRFPLLEQLVVVHCLSVKALQVTFGREVKCKVKLEELPNLIDLVKEGEEEESSQQQPQILTKLKLVGCTRLKMLGPSSMSLRNLNSLIVIDCDGMLHLISSETAKSMTQLSTLEIRRCQRIEEIISDARVDTKGCEIVFTRLEHLVLDDLPRLASFYSGNSTMRFPNLKDLVIYGCSEMESFCKHGIISTPKLKLTLKWEWKWVSKWEWESKSESSSNRIIHINSIIAEHWINSPLTALRELFAEKDLAPSNVSAE